MKMNMYPDLTYKIVASPLLEDINMDDAVDWACEMLMSGYETPTLLILSGLTKPTNYFETSQYVKNTLKELHFRTLSQDESRIANMTYYLLKIVQQKDIKGWLYSLHEFLKSEDDFGNDFSLLYWAWDEFDYSQEQHYWEGATKDNIEAIVVGQARRWLKANQTVIDTLLPNTNYS